MVNTYKKLLRQRETFIEQIQFLRLHIISGLRPHENSTLPSRLVRLENACIEYEETLAQIQLERLKQHWTISCVAKSVQNQLAAFRVALVEITNDLKQEHTESNEVYVILLSSLLSDSKIVQSKASDVLVQLLQSVYPDEIQSMYFTILSSPELSVDQPTIH